MGLLVEPIQVHIWSYICPTNILHNVQSVYYIISPLSLLSMEGSVCKLPEIVRLKKKYKVHNAVIYNAP